MDQRTESIKLLEENMVKVFQDYNISNAFGGKIPNARAKLRQRQTSGIPSNEEALRSKGNNQCCEDTTDRMTKNICKLFI